MNRAVAVLVLVALALALAPIALADTIYLKNGGKFEGKLVKETSAEYVFKIRGMGTQTFKKADVLKVEKSESAFDVYAKRRKALKPDDAQGHFELGTWCEENGLRKEARNCFRAAVEADPEHAGARGKLGYVKYEGSWITEKKHAEILKEIQEKEKGILDGLVVKKLYSDEGARFKVGIPEGWEQEAVEGGSVTFKGPTLGKAPVVVKLEAEAAGDTLDQFAETIEKSLKRDHEGLVRLADPAPGEMAGRQAKILLFGYDRDDLAVDAIPIEHRCLVAVDPAGDFVLTFTYRRGYYEVLKAFFDQVEKSVRIMPKPLDYESKDHGFGLVVPDDYHAQEGFALSTQGGQQISAPPGSVTLLRTSSRVPVFFTVVPGKKGDGKVDSSSLGGLRDSITKLIPIGNVFRLDGEEKSIKVDGQDALTGKFKLEQNNVPLGNGYWGVVMKGDRYYVAAFINFLGGMGQRYVKEDFEKLLGGFRFLEAE